MAAPALDPRALEVLRSLQENDSPGFFRHIFTMFLEETTRRIEALHRAAELRDPSSLEHTTHTLQGSCGMIGALCMSALCAKAEEFARDAAWIEVDRTVEAIDAEFHRVRAAIAIETRDPA